MYNYDTLSAATTDLKKRGFTLDFNLDENCLICNGHQYNAKDFEITEFYRFEGNTDPADEAVVYAIESVDGKKGILVNGYGISSDAMDGDIAKKLQMHRD